MELTDLEDYYYLYHKRYFAVLDKMYNGENLVSALALSDKEINNIRSVLDHKSEQHRYWTIWMLHKLEIED